ncbi:MAG: hypothetical protein OEZ68_03985 [Gammaproteobacteria bacterium]|nr:hypothetical protein [Gammaproteobacteria bacterium]MDH5799946.1 hypothetical protein [Gammaproteobacteria bacterium]
MNTAKAFIGIALTTLLFSACGTTTNTSSVQSEPDTQTQVGSMIAQAEAAFKAVDQLGGAWVNTEDMIVEAKTKASKNEIDAALKLAKEAYDEAVLAKAQFDSQKSAGPTLF